MNALTDVPAPAKLNEFLHVTGRRADGLHLLQSVFVLVDWMDVLHFERRSDGRLVRHDLGAPLPADDLCLRAAAALQAASGTALGADISIDKRLPAGAGMGGGSSDAATTLIALNRLWRLGWRRARLMRLAQTLGADVPFFVGGANAWVEGIGERIAPVFLPQATYQLVKPTAGISTAELFGALRRSEAFSPAAERPADDALLAWSATHGRNDLEPAARAHCPEVARALDWLQKRHGRARMTGSGSVVFARLDGPDDADEDAGPDAAAPEPGWIVRRCTSLAGHPLRHWVAD